MRLQRSGIIAVFATIGFLTSAALAIPGNTLFLYQGSGTETPQSQGWLDFADNAILGDGTPVVTSTGGSTTLDTTGSNNIPATSSNIEAGWSNDTPTGSEVNTLFPDLNPSPGFSVSFDVAINSESHGADDNRAGFDVIVLGDNNMGVELGFWSNDIWAQQYTSGAFSRDTSEDADTELGTTLNITPMTDYTLTITGSTYDLYAGSSLVLFGSTHNYSASAMLPYTLSNYIFMGDDTTDAQASVTFTELAVTVPEPASATAFAALCLGLLARRRRR